MMRVMVLLMMRHDNDYNLLPGMAQKMTVKITAIMILVVNNQMDLDLKIRLTCGCLIELNLNVVVSLKRV